MKYYINYIEETGQIKGFAQLGTNKNIEVTNAQYIDAQKYNKIIINGESISFEKVDFRNEKEIRISEINTQLFEKQDYLNSTDWITSKYNDEVTVLATSSKADFVAKYQDIYTARTQARIDINTLQAELESL